MFILSTGVFLLVLSLMLYGLFRSRPQQVQVVRGAADAMPADLIPAQEVQNTRYTNRWIILGGIVMPSIVLAIVFGFTIRSAAFIANEGDTDMLTVEVIGRRWWWEVNYPDHSVVTANEIHVPVGVPVEFRLLSGDVIHSFWVPQLAGKMDMVPGVENTLVLQADEPGVYRGECAEFCGLQHARMQFLVVAQSTEEFDQWVAAQQQDAAPAENEDAQRGQEVFISAGCVYCHVIRGLDSGDVDRSQNDLGPDLTHLASRMTIAAGIRDNNRGNLGGWIANPHGIKPGVLMPATVLSGADLQALLTYLETLE
ncbi:MAG: cytochrome c oxidase subunit II [Anaerolineae bacterium]